MTSSLDVFWKNYAPLKWQRRPCGNPAAGCHEKSTNCLPRTRNCISCVPRCLFHVYQLRPELSIPNMTSCILRLIRNLIGCIESYGCTKCPKIGRFLHSFVVLYFKHNYMHTCRIVELCRQHRCYIILLSNVKLYFKKNLGRRQAHYVPNIAHFKLLLWSDKKNCLSPEIVLMQLVSQYQAPDPELCSYNSYPFCRIACVIFH